MEVIKQFLLVIVIEWHSVVHELVDMKMDQITLETVPKVRLATNHWLMDCLYCKFINHILS